MDTTSFDGSGAGIAPAPSPEFLASMASLGRMAHILELCEKACAPLVDELLSQPDYGVSGSHNGKLKEEVVWSMKTAMARIFMQRVGLTMPAGWSKAEGTGG